MQENVEPGISLWSKTAVDGPAVGPLEGSRKADVVVVGAGITGLRAALELARRNIDVVVLDRHEPGWGASGRNGGQVNPMGHVSPATITRELGEARGRRLLDAYTGSADEVFELIRRESLDCEPVQKGWIRAAHCTAANAGIEQSVSDWSRIGLDIGLVEGSELQALTGTPAYRVAALTPAGGTLQPLSYTRELARVAVEKGATVCCRSAVRSVARQADGWEVATDGATVRTQWVLFCTNGYTDKALEGLRQTIVPLISTQAATRPLTKEEYARYLPEAHTVADTRRVIHYARKDNRDRILFGSLGSRESTGPSDRARLDKGLATLFPGLSKRDIAFYWGGRVAFTPDLLPHLHEPDRGILAGLGYNGRGVAMATVMGRILAERVTGKAPEELAIPTTPYRKVPFHWARDIGVAAASRYMEFRDQLDVRRG